MDWALSLGQLEGFWHSPAFPMWATLTGAAFFAIVLLITLIRADRSVANGALAVITLLAIGVAAAATVRHNSTASPSIEASSAAPGQGALACLDGLSGDKVEAACEKNLFASADSTAAAVSYTAAQISRLPIAAGQATPELAMLRRVLERDRYGLAAQVLMTREGCTPTACDVFRHLVNTNQIVANMNDRAFDALIARHEEGWAEGPALASAPTAPAAAPRGKPTTIDYPSSASIPPVNIMTPEPTRQETARQERQDSSRPEPVTQAAAPAPPSPVAPPIMAMPPNSLPFPAGTRSAPPAPPAQQAAAPAKRAPAPAKRAAAPPPAAPAPVQLVPSEAE
jgi:hypothetical protein